MNAIERAAVVSGGSGPRPPIPSRSDACTIRMQFQGRWINSPRYSPIYGGPLPWFTGYLPSMAAAGELDSTLDQLAGDTHCQVDLFSPYDEVGQPWGTIVPDCDLRNNLGTYCAIVDRVIARGFKPIFVMPSEGQPGLAWTYANLARIVAALGWRTAYGPFQYGYDGTWPDSWSPAQVQQFLPWQRSVIGDSAYSLLYFANGPSGSPYLYVFDEGDYSKPWMQALDIVLTSTTTAQVSCPSLPNYAQYMLGSNLRPTVTCAPSFQAPDWIRNIPGGLMSPGTPRGPYFWGVIEWGEYPWVRKDIPQSMIVAQRAQAAALNIPLLG